VLSIAEGAAEEALRYRKSQRFFAKFELSLSGENLLFLIFL
jgi:hypothetical protein